MSDLFEGLKKLSVSLKEVFLNDRITYFENVKINFGDYESRECGVSLSSVVRKGEDYESAFERIKEFVATERYKREKEMRIAASKYVDFNTVKKMVK